mgnify:CR=1 FL=1
MISPCASVPVYGETEASTPAVQENDTLHEDNVTGEPTQKVQQEITPSYDTGDDVAAGRGEYLMMYDNSLADNDIWSYELVTEKPCMIYFYTDSNEDEYSEAYFEFRIIDNSTDSVVFDIYSWVNEDYYYEDANFYNFPYAFGGLFARGLYAKFQQEGPAFLEKYNYMLKETPVRSVEDVAKICDIDLTKKEFWLMSLHSYDAAIEEYKRLVK